MLLVENISRIVLPLEFLQAREVFLVHVFAGEPGHHPRIRIDVFFDDIFANNFKMLFAQELDKGVRSSRNLRGFFAVVISVAVMKLVSMLPENTCDNE